MTTTTVALSGVTPQNGTTYSGGALQPAGTSVARCIVGNYDLDETLPVTLEVDIVATDDVAADPSGESAGVGLAVCDGPTSYTTFWYLMDQPYTDAITTGFTDTRTFTLPDDSPTEWATAAASGDIYFLISAYGWFEITAIRITQAVEAPPFVPRGLGWLWSMDASADAAASLDEGSAGTVFGIVSTSAPEPVLSGGAP